MILICCFVLKKNNGSRKYQKYFASIANFNASPVADNTSSVPEEMSTTNIITTSQARRTRYTGTNESIKNRNTQVVQQACLFIFAFMATLLPTFINRLYEEANGSSPFWLRLLARTAISMQGFFNVLVYTKPSVESIRKVRPDISWICAFLIVVKSGGDHDGNRLRGLRSLSRIREIGEEMELARNRHRRNSIDRPRRNRYHEGHDIAGEEFTGESVQVIISNMSNVWNALDTYEEYEDVEQSLNEDAPNMT